MGGGAHQPFFLYTTTQPGVVRSLLCANEMRVSPLLRYHLFCLSIHKFLTWVGRQRYSFSLYIGFY